MPRKHILALAIFFAIFWGSAVAQAAQPEWSIIVYVGIDEESLARDYGPRVKELRDRTLPLNVELLMEEDTYGTDGLFRYHKKGNSSLQEEVLPEQDSASYACVASFLRWAKSKATGKKRLLMLITHSWGWRGVIQDYTIPGNPSINTMLPLREYARAMRETGFKADVFWLDSCVLGNVEPIQELKDTAPYLIVSQREMPYSGFPPESLFSMLGAKGLTPREFARRVPAQYVRAYAHNGALLKAEGEFFLTTIASIDTRRWDRFTADFKTLTTDLKRAGFQDKLRRNPQWASAIADSLDSNADLVELLTRLPAFVPDPKVAAKAHKILKDIGYPAQQFKLSRESITIDPKTVKSFELRIDSDGFLPPEKALKSISDKWQENNQDFALPSDLRYELVAIRSPELRDREFIVSGELAAPLVLRPWLPGTQYYTLSTVGHDNATHRLTRSREQDYIVAERFPDTSFLLAEAHTQGAPFIHGVGLLLHPRMDASMERSTDPLSGRTGADLYRDTAWNRATGWGDIMLLAPRN